jgi:hypothetical protein
MFKNIAEMHARFHAVSVSALVQRRLKRVDKCWQKFPAMNFIKMSLFKGCVFALCTQRGIRTERLQ